MSMHIYGDDKTNIVKGEVYTHRDQLKKASPAFVLYDGDSITVSSQTDFKNESGSVFLVLVQVEPKEKKSVYSFIEECINRWKTKNKK